MRNKKIIKASSAALTIFVILTCSFTQSGSEIKDYSEINRPPVIYPDYTDTVFPPNIAPLNFTIKENGKRFFIKIYSNTGDPIEVVSANSKVQISPKSWKKLIAANRGQKVYVDIFCKGENDKWMKFDTITNTVANENIDEYAVYRLLNPAYHVWSDVGIYQRNLTNFKESVILHNDLLDKACVNCHSFHNNNPDEMMMHLRGGPGTALLLVQNGYQANINTTTDFNSSPGAYRDWHPGGDIIAFSVNKVHQFFHAKGENRDVYDQASDIILYNIKSNMVTTGPQISLPDQMETYPMWSTDGKYLYFCRAPQPVTEKGGHFPYQTVFYELMCVSYNVETGSLGEVECILPKSKTGGSVTHPRMSPDGKYILFCKCDYGNFSIYRPESDLYLLDLSTGEFRKLSINSDRSDSYHSWSSNGRWFIFSSKRQDGILAKLYISYFDTTGKAYKPVLLPQKDPAFYDTFIQTFNVPELVTGPVKIDPGTLRKLAYDRKNAVDANLDPAVMSRDDSPDLSMPWQSAPN